MNLYGNDTEPTGVKPFMYKEAWTNVSTGCGVSSNPGWNNYDAVTGNSSTGISAMNGIGVSGTEKAKEYTFDITSAVKLWKKGEKKYSSEYGLMFQNGVETNSSYRKKVYMREKGGSLAPCLKINFSVLHIITLGATINGNIAQGDIYCYKFVPIQTDIYNVYTTGNVDTYCDLYQDSSLLESDDDDGDGNNFKITRKLYKGKTYYLIIRGYNSSTSGNYCLKIDSDFLNQLQKLHNLAKKYSGDNSKAVELTMQFIRRKKYDGTYSKWDKWALAAGNIDDAFVDYVNSNNTELYDYFTIKKGEDFFYYLPNGNVIDVPHLCATYNILTYNSIGNFGEIYLAENLIDNLGGWGGDLRSMIPWVIKKTNNSSDYQTIYNMTYSMIGATSCYFSMQDLYADVDAYNLYKSINTDSLKTTLINYYFNGGISTRFTDFTNGWSYGTIRSIVKQNCSTANEINIIWPMKQLDDNGNDTSENISLSETQLNAISNAFTDYIWNRAQAE